MDHELKQRLIGAVVVTALCAIFIPMLFDDPVDNNGQLVSELNIPAPADKKTDVADKLPGNSDQVLKPSTPEPEAVAAEVPEAAASVEDIPEDLDKPGHSEESLYAESEGYDAREGAPAEEVVEQPVVKTEESQSKSRPKAPVEKPLLAEDADIADKKIVAPKVPVKETRVDAMVQEPAKTKKAVEPPKPVLAKKPETVIGKVNALTEAAKPTAIKQPSSAKTLAAAIADAKEPAPAPKTAPKLVRWYIQIGSFSKKENAMSLWESLREQGLPASIDTVQTDKGTSYRLRVGPELDGKKAAAMKLRLDRQNIKAILMSE